MSWEEIGENVYVLHGEKGSPNTGVILKNRIAFVIDPGMGNDRDKRIHEKIDELNAVRRFGILTHAHVDHMAACRGFERVFAHRWETILAECASCRNVCEFNVGKPKGFKFITAESVPITDEIWWGDEILGIQVIDTHGHTPGHTAFAYGDFVFAGDALFGDRLLDKVRILYHTDVFEAMKSLDALGELARAGKTIVPGHGPIVSGDKAIDLVQKNREAINRMLDDLWQILEKPGTLEEVTLRLMEYYGLKTDLEFVLLDMTPIRSIVWQWSSEGKLRAKVKEKGIVWTKTATQEGPLQHHQ